MTSPAPKSKDLLLTLRYGDQPVPPMAWNDQIAGLVSHKTARAYLPDRVPDEALNAMVAAAQSASTSSNLHQWSVIAVTDPEQKATLSALSQGSMGHGNPHIDEAPVLLLWVADLARSNQLAKQGGIEAEVHGYVDAFLMSTVDAALASQAAVVAAESLGLAVCYLGSMRNRAADVAEAVSLPPHAFVAFGMTLGYPDPSREALVTPRPQQAVVLHRNWYNLEQTTTALESYSSVFDGFRDQLSERAGLRLRPWIDGVIASAKHEYMDGRENLRATVATRGFLLK